MQAGLGAARSRPAAGDDPQHRPPHTAAARAGCTGTAALLGLPAVLRGSISSHSPPELRLCCGTGDASSPPRARRGDGVTAIFKADFAAFLSPLARKLHPCPGFVPSSISCRRAGLLTDLPRLKALQRERSAKAFGSEQPPQDASERRAAPIASLLSGEGRQPGQAGTRRVLRASAMPPSSEAPHSSARCRSGAARSPSVPLSALSSEPFPCRVGSRHSSDRRPEWALRGGSGPALRPLTPTWETAQPPPFPPLPPPLLISEPLYTPPTRPLPTPLRPPGAAALSPAPPRPQSDTAPHCPHAHAQPLPLAPSQPRRCRACAGRCPGWRRGRRGAEAGAARSAGAGECGAGPRGGGAGPSRAERSGLRTTASGPRPFPQRAAARLRAELGLPGRQLSVPGGSRSRIPHRPNAVGSGGAERCGIGAEGSAVPSCRAAHRAPPPTRLRGCAAPAVRSRPRAAAPWLRCRPPVGSALRGSRVSLSGRG